LIVVPVTQTTPKNDPLAFHLRGAAQAVAQVKSGTALPQALARVFLDGSLSPQARGAIQDIAYHTMRQLGLAEGLLALLTVKPVQTPVLQGLLSCALALLAGENEDNKEKDGARYDAFTIVNQAVDAAAADPDMAHAKGMVNAVLRRFLREQATLLPQVRKTPAGNWNYPVWWIDRIRDAYPDQWQAILHAGNRQPPLTLRVNQRKTTLTAYLQMLQDAGLEASAVGPLAVKLHKPIPVAQIPGFTDGLSSVQDAGAQLAAPLLDVQPGMRVLDACAAPGGKTGHLLEMADITLTALDHDPKRLRRIAENLERLQLQATLVAGDAGAGAEANANADTGTTRSGQRHWWDGRRFDRILADLPCTASGIVRRHPDIRWLRRKTDTAQLATLSAGILDNLWQMLEPDGKLLLVTCSLWPQESEQQAVAFSGRNKDAIRLPAPGQLLPTTDAQQDHDGLFYALFQKNGTGT
jgi:16S rRNA (cytosine967-C5)-methyltransferase